MGTPMMSRSSPVRLTTPTFNLLTAKFLFALLHLYRTPAFFKLLSPHLEWKIKTHDKTIFLTFDDGPIPGLTPYILNQLYGIGARATFFCVGDNVCKFPEIFQAVIDRGHAVGNHTFNHLKAWKTSTAAYLENVHKCQRVLIENGLVSDRPLFRPPHGQLTPRAINTLKQAYRIIMWDVLSYDFSKAHTAEKSLDQIIKKTRPGSIVVFHDNYKAEEKLKYVLPRYLRHFSELGYSFKKLTAD
jgi:peptidoglycan/xylan/chitin deacetylase (PgdA/CDA1 family)